MNELIADAGGMEIYAADCSAYSFFASPYQAHRDFAAVDICQQKKFGDTAFSPVSGEVLKTIRFDSPSPAKESLPEYLILIKKGGSVARIMHVKPDVRPGERISVGDELGAFISNGFFSYWVDPIIHMEVRKEGNHLRPVGGLELKPSMAEEGLRPSSGLFGEVTHISRRNVTLRLGRKAVASVAGNPAFLDGATCLDYAGVIGTHQVGETVFLMGIPIGKIMRSSRFMSTFATEPLEVSANGLRFKGICFSPSSEEIKLLPESFGDIGFEAGEHLSIGIKKI